MVSTAFLNACEPADPDDHPNEPTPTVSTKSFEARVLNDFGVFPAVPDAKLTNVEAPSIEVGKGKVAIFAMKKPEVPASCVIAAQLRLFLQEATERISTELAIYPSHVFNALQKRDGDRFGYSGSALDIRPRATLDEDVTRGWSAWDVTDVVRRWLSRRPFPSTGARVPKRGPIVFTLRDMDGAKPFATATLASSDGADQAPHLIITQRHDCT